MRAAPLLLRTALIICTAGMSGGCANAAVGAVDDHAAPVALSTEAVTSTVVPRVVELEVELVDKEFAAAGLVPILRYEPGIIAGAGTVVNTEPAVGSTVPLGSTVTVVVAGPAAQSLPGYVDAHRDSFIGYAIDSSGVAVVAVYQKADLGTVMKQLNGVAGGKAFRVQSCARSWSELQRIQVELSRRDFLPGVETIAFAASIDPLACAVRLTINLTDPQIAELTSRYQGALVIQKGDAERMPAK